MAANNYGWCGKILKVALTDSKISEVESAFLNPEAIIPGAGDKVISRRGQTLDRKIFETMLSLQVFECQIKQFRFNRFLYQLVGESWEWRERLSWTDDQWKVFAESENLRTWVAYFKGSPAGYYELQRQDGGNVEIADFGLAPKFIGQGFGGYLLGQAIKSAWDWKGTKRVWVHTCTLDHPSALQNYKARGMEVYRVETEQKD